MRRRALIPIMLLAVSLPGAMSASASASPTVSPPTRTMHLVAFRSRFGGGGLFGRTRSYGYGSRYGGYSSRYYRRPSLLHRVARALAFAYILHLLFTNGAFSLLLWVLIIALFARLFRRRRVRRYSYF